MSHFGETVYNNKNGIFAISSSRQTKHKIHANIFPWLIWNWKWHVKAMRSHKVTIFEVIAFPRCMRQTFGIRNSKSRILLIQVFYVLKANDVQFKLSYKNAYT